MFSVLQVNQALKTHLAVEICSLMVFRPDTCTLDPLTQSYIDRCAKAVRASLSNTPLLRDCASVWVIVKWLLCVCAGQHGAGAGEGPSEELGRAAAGVPAVSALSGAPQHPLQPLLHALLQRALH